MASSNRPARLNRTLLALLGLLLVLAGGGTLAFGLRLLPEIPGLDPAAPLAPSSPTAPGWAAWVAAAAGIVIGLLSLRWLLAQAWLRPKTGTWRLPAAPGAPGRTEYTPTGVTRLHSDHVADAVAAEITCYPGVRRAHAALTGPPGQPTLHLDITTDPTVSVTGLHRQIESRALLRLRHAIDATTIDTRLLLRLSGQPAPRVS